MIPAGRFILRPYRHSDAAAINTAVHESMASIGQWLSWATPAFSTDDAACWVALCMQARAARSAHEFGIFTAEGEFVGGCGLNGFSTQNNLCNLGYWVRLSHQRSGAASAAVLALRELGLEGLGLSRIEIVIADGNHASMAVARKTGATYECLARNRLQLHGRAVAGHVFSFTSDELA